MLLNQKQVSFYKENGYLLLKNVINPEKLSRIRKIIVQYLEQSKQHTGSNKIFDLDPTHTANKPCVRRLKNPHMLDRVFHELSQDSCIIDPICQLLGGTVRFDHSKLNFKTEHGQTEIAWHQDWAFYPHTNDDILAVGIMIEDCSIDDGPLMVIPQSHQGPIFNHHHNGIFAGGINSDELKPLLNNAVTLTGKAGDITIHHVRTLHASKNSRTDFSRPLLLFSYSAVNAFPIFDSYDINEYNSRIIRGEAVIQGRMESLPFRIHKPQRVGPIQYVKTKKRWSTHSLLTTHKLIFLPTQLGNVDN